MSKTIDAKAEFRHTLGRFATGVTVITVQTGDEVHGMTANAFMSVSLDPPLVVVSVDKRTKMHGFLDKGVRYGVSVLHETQAQISDHFGGRRVEGEPDPEFAYVLDTPVIAGAGAHLVAQVVETYWGGDHTLFLGQVEYTRSEDSAPLLFFGGKYQRLFG